VTRVTYFLTCWIQSRNVLYYTCHKALQWIYLISYFDLKCLPHKDSTFSYAWPVSFTTARDLEPIHLMPRLSETAVTKDKSVTTLEFFPSVRCSKSTTKQCCNAVRVSSPLLGRSLNLRCPVFVAVIKKSKGYYDGTSHIRTWLPLCEIPHCISPGFRAWLFVKESKGARWRGPVYVWDQLFVYIFI
jgi:hypothetical protein